MILFTDNPFGTISRGPRITRWPGLLRISRAVIITAVIGLLVFPSTSASASGKPTRIPFPDAWNTLDFPSGVACSFELAASPVVNKEVWTTFPTEPNGDRVRKATGHLVEQFTNVSTGKSLTFNISGPSTFTFHADGSVTTDTRGQSILFLFPGDIPAGPITLMVSGHYVTQTSPAGQTVLESLSGSHSDLCAALA